jgi:hypothetical protein
MQQKRSFRQLSTRTKANTGARFEILDPGTKVATGEWLHVLGSDSDKATEATRRASQETLAFIESCGGNVDKKSAAYAAHMEKQELDLMAALVESWSFEEDCTPENVREFFINAPAIRREVDRFAGKLVQFDIASS